ncbi:MAG: hypothetical protein LZF60_250069 [Nitrospira sp.]|nr:MAG: hypothetical protein LZF60_250069 [Nitrospira sp.]
MRTGRRNRKTRHGNQRHRYAKIRDDFHGDADTREPHALIPPVTVNNVFVGPLCRMPAAGLLHVAG